ncbi:mitochondrial iron ion transporter [Coprinopsis sp. MPI-PUGE-AT-0042]|nr:mitochondrial iron ion transporter [Coprinopsis sp. MPI-PUGE-AT-0042]
MAANGTRSISSTPNNSSLRQRQKNGGKEAAHDHDHGHSHEHSHSLFGHSHSHGEEGHSHDAEQIVAALKGSGDRGSRITLIGLFSNIGLTAAKGLAGWYMHSAALLADAGHSLSDLLGDFVVLFCWRLSRKPPSQRYPYGFAKFETLGTTTISILLIGGALGIGFHSYHLLLSALADSAHHLTPGPLQEALQWITSKAALPQIGHAHEHGLDPNAMWFALIGVASKEWLYRITKVVADEEKSPVLLANAIHHRSDAYSSLVAFFAILGTWLFPAFPLDPIGGLIVSVVIFQQGFSLLKGAWGDLTDASVSPKTRRSIEDILLPLIAKADSSGAFPSSETTLLDVSHVRCRRAGSQLFVDLTAVVPTGATVDQIHDLDTTIQQTLKASKKEIAEIRIKFEPSTSHAAQQ